MRYPYPQIHYLCDQSERPRQHPNLYTFDAPLLLARMPLQRYFVIINTLHANYYLCRTKLAICI